MFLKSGNGKADDSKVGDQCNVRGDLQHIESRADVFSAARQWPPEPVQQSELFSLEQHVVVDDCNQRSEWEGGRKQCYKSELYHQLQVLHKSRIDSFFLKVFLLERKIYFFPVVN